MNISVGWFAVTEVIHPRLSTRQAIEINLRAGFLSQESTYSKSGDVLVLFP
ncbi:MULTISPECIES: hypothetical protein [Brasilonema]|uniref:hypothetical protein n=1 Tax=Brasilonema TaxID=383614 RepID=UPI00145EA2D7|nr:MULTISPECIES: hypothetical protein [Brasilonema]